MNKKNWFFVICLSLAAAGAAAGMLFLFMQLDLTPFLKYVPGDVSEAAVQAAKSLGCEGGKLAFNGMKLAEGLASYGKTEALSPLAVRMLQGLRTMTLVPVLFVAGCVTLGLVRNRFARIAGLLVALTGTLFVVYSALFFFPQAVREQVSQEEIRGVMDLAEDAQEVIQFGELLGYPAEGFDAGRVKQQIASLSPGTMQKILFHSLGPGWWLLSGSLLFLVLLFAAGYAVLIREERAGDSASRTIISGSEPNRTLPGSAGGGRGTLGIAFTGPAVLVEKGSEKGTRFELDLGTRLSIGGDSRQCTMVLRGQGIDPLHCVISYDPGRREYHVRDYSAKGIWCGGYRLNNRRVNFLPGDTRLILGNNEDAVLYLEMEA